MRTHPTTMFARTLTSLAFFATSLVAQNLGMITDRSGRAFVFDPDTDTLLGTVVLTGTSLPIFDCVITKDLKRGFIADFNNRRVWVIDLTTAPPSLASGTNPIPVSVFAEDLSLSRDQKFLLVADGGGSGQPLSVVDVAQQKEINTLSLGATSNPSAVEVCPDGSVLVVERTSGTTTRIRRYTIDGAGNLTDTGQVLGNASAPDVHNLTCMSAPGKSGKVRELLAVFVSRRACALVGTIRVDGLVPLSTQALSGPFGIDATLSRGNTWLYVRTNAGPFPGPSGAGNGFIDAFKLKRHSSQFGAKKFTIQLGRRTGTAFGVEQTAVHPSKPKLYVSGLRLPEVRFYHAHMGKLLGKFTAPGMAVPLGICIVRGG